LIHGPSLCARHFNVNALRACAADVLGDVAFFKVGSESAARRLVPRDWAFWVVRASSRGEGVKKIWGF
jgi:hypothetical protein